MNEMFSGAAAFNQDLSKWCVNKLSNEPTNFALKSALSGENTPKWGQCPKFYLHQNGVTVLCPNAALSESGMVGGVTFTKRSKSQITESNAPTTCTSGIDDISQLFYGKSSFNADISHWGTSQVTSMYYMFYEASSFNQDLSWWCVPKIPYEPMGFATESSLSPRNQPIWGECRLAGNSSNLVALAVSLPILVVAIISAVSVALYRKRSRRFKESSGDSISFESPKKQTGDTSFLKAQPTKSEITDPSFASVQHEKKNLRYISRTIEDLAVDLNIPGLLNAQLKGITFVQLRRMEFSELKEYDISTAEFIRLKRALKRE